MTVSEHKYGGYLLVTPYITEPAYDVPTPALEVYSYGFEDYAETVYPAGQVVYSPNFDVSVDGWTHAAPGTASSRDYSSDAPAHSGTYTLAISSDSPYASKAVRTVTGLVVGRSYTFRAWAGRDNPGKRASVGVTGKGTGTVVTGWVYGTWSWKECTYTFTATATSHEFVLSGTYTSGNGRLSPDTWDDVTLTGAAYTAVSNPGLGGWTGTVQSAVKRTGADALQAVSTTRTFTGLEVGRSYTLAGYRYNGTNWLQITSTFTATAASMARTLTATGATHWDDITLTRNAYTTTVPPVYSNRRELSVKGGSITLDAGSAPHVRGDVVLSVRDTPTLDALDPRQSSRVVITTDAVMPGSTLHREFDLGLRERNVPQSDGSVNLTLASDEALMQDYAPLADDLGAFSRQASLVSIVNYALGKSIPGAALQPGQPDSEFYVYSDAQNLIPDPRVANFPTTFTTGNVSQIIDGTFPGAQDGIAHNGVHLHAPTSNDGYLSIGGDTGELVLRLGMSAGKTYVFSATGSVRATIGGTNAEGRQRTLVVHAWSPQRGYTIWRSPAVPNVAQSGTSGTRVSVEFTLPEDTQQAWVRAYHGGTSGSMSWGLFSLVEGNPNPGVDDTEYFWGAKPDTAGYRYDWDGTPEASASTRTALIDRAPELLVWKAGQDALDFVHPLVQVAGLRLVCNEKRQWTLRNENYVAAESLSIRHAINLIDGDETISRDSGLWYDAAAVVYTWNDSEGITQTRIDAYSLTPTYSRLERFERTTPYPGPGLAQYLVRRAQGRGREVTASSVSDWRANAEQAVTLFFENAPTQIGLTQSVRFNLDNDEMTVTTRATDTPFGAIDLKTGTIDALAGTIDSL